MAESIFMKVSEVAKELGVSESYAYKLVRKLNKGSYYKWSEKCDC